ncbi:MAG TPA: DUF433 domain-containing protein [Roseiflexaceae bacterium]|nr:DUF433 domain-containing protein [Roseiflexaceae bacterium]
MSGVARYPDICDGALVVTNTRIRVAILKQMRDSGSDDAAILQQYPTLSQQQLNAVWEHLQHESLLPKDFDENEDDDKDNEE